MGSSVGGSLGRPESGPFRSGSPFEQAEWDPDEEEHCQTRDEHDGGYPAAAARDMLCDSRGRRQLKTAFHWPESN